jgi:Flp pilus assembly protein TadG
MNRLGALCPRLRRGPVRLLLEHPRDERGSSAVETLIMATAAMSLVLIVVASGRYVDGSAQANDAAYAAARAASLETAPGPGYAAGRQAAMRSLAERGKSCQNLQVSFAGTNFTPGGDLTAEVTCTVNLLDTGALGRQLGLQPHRSFTERAVVPIETYRSAGGTP